MFKRPRRRSAAKQPVRMECLEDRQLLSTSLTATATSKPTASLGTTFYGQAVTLSASVTAKKGAPTGIVTFEDGSAVLGSGVINSSTHIASFTTSSLSLGTHNITAIYGGAKTFAGSSSPLATTETVNAATTTTVTPTAATVSIGQNETFTATVTSASNGKPVTYGTVTFTMGGTTLATAAVNSAGQATYSEYNWFMGSSTVTATYNSFLPNSTSTGSTTVNINLPTLITPPTDKNSDGLLIATVTPGAGPGVAEPGPAISVDYTGYLTDGTKFDSSLNPGRTPFIFGLSENEVITGWIEGIPGMKVGETRVLEVPSALAYGTAGQGDIPPNATLYFIVKLLSANAPRVEVSQLVSNSTNVTALTENGTTVTATVNSIAGIAVGTTVNISGATSSGSTSTTGYNGSFEVTGVSGNTFTYTSTASLGTASGSVTATTFKLNTVALNQPASTANGTDFGSVPVGDSGNTVTFVLQTADQAFNLSPTGSTPVEISGADPQDFQIVQPTSSNGEEFTITFVPTAKGTRTATIHILTNDPVIHDFTFTVTGIGT